jgi:hypothetical protein
MSIHETMDQSKIYLMKHPNNWALEFMNLPFERYLTLDTLFVHLH